MWKMLWPAFYPYGLQFTTINGCIKSFEIMTDRSNQTFLWSTWGPIHASKCLIVFVVCTRIYYDVQHFSSPFLANLFWAYCKANPKPFAFIQPKQIISTTPSTKPSIYSYAYKTCYYASYFWAKMSEHIYL